MHLIDAHRRLVEILLGAPREPVRITPLVTMNVPGQRSGLRPVLGEEGKGIALVEEFSMRADQLKLVVRIRTNAGNEQFPNARLNAAAHGMRATVPSIEISDHGHATCVRRPYGKLCPLHPVHLTAVRAEVIVKLPVRALAEEVHVQITQAEAEGV